MPGVPPHPPVDLKDLATRLSSAPLRDELVLEGLNHYLQGFRGCIDGRDEHLRGCLDAASTMVCFLKHLDDGPAGDVRAMAVRLLGLVHDAASSKRPRGALESVQAALPSTTSPAETLSPLATKKSCTNCFTGAEEACQAKPPLPSEASTCPLVPLPASPFRWAGVMAPGSTSEAMAAAIARVASTASWACRA